MKATIRSYQWRCYYGWHFRAKVKTYWTEWGRAIDRKGTKIMYRNEYIWCISCENCRNGAVENNLVNKVLKQGIKKELEISTTSLISKSGFGNTVFYTGAPIFDIDGKVSGLVFSFQGWKRKAKLRKIKNKGKPGKYRTAIAKLESALARQMTDAVFLYYLYRGENNKL